MSKEKMQRFTRTMGARPERAEQPLTSGPSRGLTQAEVVTIVRRLGFVALKAFEAIQGNLISSQKFELAETLNDCLKPLVDLLVHFELPGDEDEGGDHGVST